MSRYEQVMISTDASFEDLVDTVARVLDASDVSINVRGHTVVQFPWADAAVLVDSVAGEYVDDKGMPLSQYEYLLEIWTHGPRGDDYVAQMAAARAVFDRLAAATDWRLLLAFNDLQREGGRRD